MLSVDTRILPTNTTEAVDSMKKRPFDDPISKEDVEVIVKRALGSKVKIVNYHLRTYSQEKLGFLGDHRHLIVTVQHDGSIEKQIQTFFLKSIPYGNEIQASIISESKAFDKETSFYQKILPELMKSVKDKSWIAQCYLVKNDAMVFEDLKSKNFSGKTQLLEIDLLKSGLTALAKLHASSMLAEKRMGKTFIELHPEILKEYQIVRTDPFGKWIRSGVDVVVGVAKSLKLNAKKISLACDRIFDLIKSKTEKNVICHGDTKSFNFMFDNSKPLPKCVLVDFQLIRYTTPLADVLQFLYLTTRREFRDKYEKDLLRFYSQVFVDCLKENDPEIKAPTAPEIIKEYEEKRLIGIVTVALYAPTHFMNTLKCAEITKDSEGFEKIFSGDRLNLVLEIMQEDAFYNDMMTEIVKELVERSEEFIL